MNTRQQATGNRQQNNAPGSSPLPVARCPLPVHVSEHKWGDDPYEEERFEAAQAKDYATLFAAGCLFVFVVLFLAVAYWFVTTITPGRLDGNTGLRLKATGNRQP